jgi:hypothetical protein
MNKREIGQEEYHVIYDDIHEGRGGYSAPLFFEGGVDSLIILTFLITVSLVFTFPR